jgi:drug/metabolite transporter (DMT)-like permease
VRQTHLALALTLVGAGLWGLSGTVAQGLFERFSFPVLGLVTVRMLSASALLLLVFGRRGRPAFTPSFLSLSIFGIAASQITYLEAIEFSNAVTATLLQFLFLPMVATYEALRGEIVWSHGWTAILVLAAAGTVLLVANPGSGSFGILVTPAGLLFGILSAVAGTYYSIAGRRLAQQHGSWPITTWGFAVGGLVTLPFGAVSLVSYSFPSSVLPWLELAGLIGFIVVFGTLLGYGLYLVGLRHLPATEVGAAASLEPIVAAVATYFLLGVKLTALQYVGGALIVLAVGILGLRRYRDRDR